MLSRTFINRLIIFGFLVLVGFSLAKALYHKSVMGIILAFVSLLATIYFLYLVARIREEARKEETA